MAQDSGSSVNQIPYLISTIVSTTQTIRAELNKSLSTVKKGGSIAFKNYQARFEELLRRFEGELEKILRIPIPEGYLETANIKEEDKLRNAERARVTEEELDRLTDFFSDTASNREEIARYLRRFRDDIESDAFNNTTIFHSRAIDTQSDVYETNREKLLSGGTFNSLNDHIVKRVSLLDFKYLPTFDEYRAYVWMIYLQGLRERLSDCTDSENSCNFNPRKLLPFDLLFQPANTIVYSPRVVAVVYFFKYKFLDDITNFLGKTKRFILEFSKFTRNARSLHDRMKLRLDEEAGSRDVIWRKREEIESSLRANLGQEVQQYRKLRRDDMIEEIEDLREEVKKMSAAAKLLDIMDKRVNNLSVIMDDYEKRQRNFIDDIMTKITEKLASENTEGIDRQIEEDLNKVRFVTTSQLLKYKDIGANEKTKSTLEKAAQENEEADQEFRVFHQGISAAIDALL